MNKTTITLLLLSGLLLTGAWLPAYFFFTSQDLSPARAEAAEAQKTSAGETYSIKDLPCFKCHIYDRFLQEPAPGVFSHALHIQFEYHCNQCHSFRGHRQMAINTAICTFCHEAVPQLRKE